MTITVASKILGICWYKLQQFALIIMSSSLKDKTVNKEMGIDILRGLRDAVRRKRPEKWRINS
jgi:hypothetical protein